MPELPKIALLGASGQVGGLYLNLALSAGHKVRALVRDKGKLEPMDGLTIIEGDATRTPDIATLIEGVDVVVSCVGNSKNNHVMESTAKSVLGAARARANPPKAIFISSLGCGGTSWLIKMVSILLGGKKTFDDYNRADALIASTTDAPIVLVRPTGFTDKPGTGKYAVFRSGVTFAKLIPRADVAQFLFDATLSATWDGPGGVQLGGFEKPD